MNTNINSDNYEAYLLDYMEGNLSHEETEQLKAFVAAKGLNWDELTEELPYLEAPAVTYEDKESLKKKSIAVPLYVKIASAAAAAGLLLTVTLWPEKTPEVDPVVEVKPVVEVDSIFPPRLITSGENQTLPPQTITYSTPKTKADKKRPRTVKTKTNTALLTDLLALKTVKTPTALTTTYTEEPNLIPHHTSPGLAFAQFDESNFAEDNEDERNLSFIGRGIYRLTDGRHDSFASLISSGLSTAKKEISLAATDMALTAYYRADEHFEEAKERWEEKRGE